ncbi:MAG: LacI family DNA-binding transcriptional regulator [Ruminococcus sp.]
MSRKKPTIQMVADMAGVSRGTVDRVLNNRSHVRPAVYQKVMAALKETGYLTPRDSYQKTLFEKNYPPLKLGVLLPNWSGHFKWEIENGIEAAREELAEFHVTIVTEECSTDIPEDTIHHLQNLLDQQVQGLAVCAVNDVSVCRKISSLVKNGIPVITFNSDLPDSGRLCFVGQDYKKSGRIAAELISKCITKDAHILAAVGNLEFDGHRSRLNGFCDRSREVGFSDSQITVMETFNDYQITYRKITQALQEQQNIQAIYMANRSVAACTKAVEAAGRKGQIHVVCHDISEHTQTLLKNGDIDFSISQDLFRQGYLPLIYLRDYLHKDKYTPDFDNNPQISIVCSQNL